MKECIFIFTSIDEPQIAVCGLCDGMKLFRQLLFRFLLRLYYYYIERPTTDNERYTFVAKHNFTVDFSERMHSIRF